MLVVFILNQPCKTVHLQTLYICKPFTSRHYKYPSRNTNLKTSLRFGNAGDNTEFTDFNTQCCPKIRLCGWVKVNHFTLVFSFCLRTLMKLTTPVDSEFPSLALQYLTGHMSFWLFSIHMSFLAQSDDYLSAH